MSVRRIGRSGPILWRGAYFGCRVLMSALSAVVPEGLVEREVELARMHRLLDQASNGVGAVGLVEGAAGIGKSEFLAALRAGAQARGYVVLSARGSEFEAEIAFGVARQLFEPMLRTASAAERRRLLGGVAQVGARALGVESGEPPADRFAAIHGLFWLCANQAERRPVVVAVDDAQWVDDPSLAWLGYLGRRAADLPLLLVLSLRWGDPDGERSELERLAGDNGVQRIPLGPLSAPGVAAIVRAQLDEDADQPFCSACWELSGGNPLLLRELLAAARGEGLPARVVSVSALQLIAPAAVGPSVLSLRACGLVEGGDAGLELLGQAVQTLRRAQSPLELARALSDHGAALRRAGHRIEARAALQRALDLAHHCGAHRIANQARTELIAAGAKPRRDAITGRDGLTASELRVARLAADGLTNREIAQALFITTRTAKAHLSHVYRKLAISRRGQLPDALSGRLGGVREDPSATATIIS